MRSAWRPVVRNEKFGRIQLTHVNLNDGTAEGIAFLDIPAFSVQYHPEASPGPTDAHYLFTAFSRLMDGREDYLDIDIAADRLAGWKFGEKSMPKRTDIKSILVIGSGPIVIGQACEFDYSGAQACKVLKADGYRVILVNSNPATIMTDPGSRRSHLRRANHARVRRESHREGTPRRASPDARRPDRSEHRRRPGEVWRA